MTVPGSLFRRSVFWLHLSSGIAAGLVVLVLSITGVLLAFEKQIVAIASRANRVSLTAEQLPLGADALVDAVKRARPDARGFTLTFDADPAMPVTASRGRELSLLIHPYTGETVDDAAAGTREFMRTVTRWHRTLAGEGNSARATVVDLANLLFLFMIVSGLYLWLPAVWRWRTVKGLVLFRARYVNAKARDFSWHHVFGVWALVPLFLITLSGVVISYPWANALVYKAYGEEAPLPRGPPGGAGEPQRPDRERPSAAGEGAGLDALLAAARARVSDWRKLTIPSNVSTGRVEVVAELDGGGPRPPRQTIVLDAIDATVVSVSAPSGGGNAAPSAAQRARTWLRFIHTGEQYGIIGQTIAALASLAACFLVYTGLALAWRRLIVPLWTRREAGSAPASSTV